MGTRDIDVLVLRNNSRGSTADRYADALQDRLPDLEVGLARTHREERELIATASVVTGRTIDEDLLEHASAIRLFAGFFAGYDHLPIESLRERGVAVTTGSGIHAPNVSEWIIANLLVFARQLHVSWQRGQDREWRYVGGEELGGSTIAVVGQGAIGTTLVERLGAFDVETLAIRHSPEKGGPADEVVGYDPDEVHDVFARADALALTCPLTETTEGFIDDEAFRTLQPHTVLLNAARGEVVDTEALVRAIQFGSIGGAALDVTDPEPLPPEHPLWTFDNVFVTPHNAGGSSRMWNRLADLVAGNIVKARKSGAYRDLENQVVTP